MMSLENISKIAVVGAGTMGQGIAQISALAGYDVVLYDLSESALKKAETIIDSNLSKGIDRGKLSQVRRLKHWLGLLIPKMMSLLLQTL